MDMRMKRTLVLPLVALALLVGVLGSTAAVVKLAHAVPAQAAAAGGAKSCTTYLAKLRPGERISQVLATRCEAGGRVVSASSVVPDFCLVGTKLITWYVDANYRGNDYTIVGCSGPCDHSGYGINYVGAEWNDKISSFQTFNHCNETVAYVDANRTCAQGCQIFDTNNVSWIGSYMNDRTSSFQLRYP
jgi:hypothetical protein